MRPVNSNTQNSKLFHLALNFRSALLSMVRDAGLLEGKSNRSGLLGTVQRPSLSPQALALIGNDSDLRAGFLLMPKQKRAKR